jgi:hypothetical protein
MKAFRDTITAIFIGGLILYLIGSLSGGARTSPSSMPATDEPAQTIPLKADPYHCDKDYDYIRCEGRVTNVSPASLRHVLAFAQCFAKDGTFVTSEWSGLQYDPVLSGQTSPYTLLIRYNPAIKGCKISFKYLSGQFIPSTEPEWPPQKHSTRRQAGR